MAYKMISTEEVCSCLLAVLEEVRDFHEGIDSATRAHHALYGTPKDHYTDPMLLRIRKAVEMAQRHGVRPPAARLLNMAECGED